MAAVQETIRTKSRDKEASGPKRVANQGVQAASPSTRGAFYADIPNRVWGVRRIALNIVGAEKEDVKGNDADGNRTTVFGH